MNGSPRPQRPGEPLFWTCTALAQCAQAFPSPLVLQAPWAEVRVTRAHACTHAQVAPLCLLLLLHQLLCAQCRSSLFLLNGLLHGNLRQYPDNAQPSPLAQPSIHPLIHAYLACFSSSCCSKTSRCRSDSANRFNASLSFYHRTTSHAHE